MFTGIIETTGEVLGIRNLRDGGGQMTIRIPFADGLSPGESLAVNGCCLTVAEIEGSDVAFDLSQQTMEVTNLGQFPSGSLVNLERSLPVSGRLGGHFIQGHIDETAEVLYVRSQGQDTIFSVALPAAGRELVIPRGSIAVDGISLTIAELGEVEFTLWIVRHTLEVTNLKRKSEGDRVNLEYDLLGKYVQRQLRSRGGDPSDE